MSRPSTTTLTQYKALDTLAQRSDDAGILVEETLLVEHRQQPAQFSLRIIELRDAGTMTDTLREVKVLEVLGQHGRLQGLFDAFRHRQYVGLLLPHARNLRCLLDHRYQQYKLSSKRQPGICDRSAVVHVLKGCLEALTYVHSRGLVHTEIAADNIYLDGMGDVRLGGFLHSRKLGSKYQKHTGHPVRHPPETFHKEEALPAEETLPTEDTLPVRPSFDIWAIGLLTLELITGLNSNASEEQMRRISRDYLDGTMDPPSLATVDPSFESSLYDEDVDEFVRCCLHIDPKRRITTAGALQHPFIAKPIDETDAKWEWKASVPAKAPNWKKERSLHAEMFSAQGGTSQMKTGLLLRINNAIELARDNYYPIVEKVPADQLKQRYVAVEAMLAVQSDGEEWSRDVLDVSHSNSRDFLNDYRQEQANNRKSGAKLFSDVALLGDQSLKADAMKLPTGKLVNYQRNHTIFFVGKDWEEDRRQLFVALQFARWHLRGLIEFSDLVRMVDEIDDIFAKYVLQSPSPDAEVFLPESVCFVSVLRKGIIDSAVAVDRDTWKYNHAFIDVSLKPSTTAQKMVTFGELVEDDPVAMPKGKTMLQVSVAYREVNIRHLEMLEKLMIGDERIDEWDFLPEQRLDDAADPHTELRYLLDERRRNPNLKVSSYNTADASNQARTAKIWSTFDRDFMFRFCKFAVPRRVDEQGVRALYQEALPQPNTAADVPSQDLDELSKQLLRTRIKQEEDVIIPIKEHEDVEARQAAVEEYAKGDAKHHEKRNQRLEATVRRKLLEPDASIEELPTADS